MGQVDVQKFNSEQIAELQERVTNLELMVNGMHDFIKNQVAINEFFRRIVDDKYSKEELLAIYNRAEERKKAEKEEKTEENNDDILHKNCTNLKNSEKNCEAPDEKGVEN